MVKAVVTDDRLRALVPKGIISLVLSAVMPTASEAAAGKSAVQRNTTVTEGAEWAAKKVAVWTEALAARARDTAGTASATAEIAKITESEAALQMP